MSYNYSQDAVIKTCTFIRRYYIKYPNIPIPYKSLYDSNVSFNIIHNFVRDQWLIVHENCFASTTVANRIGYEITFKGMWMVFVQLNQKSGKVIL